jgi:hypothetical protein
VSRPFAPEFDKFAKENKGMFRVGSIDCGQFATICNKEKIEKFPHLRIYPPFPAPTQDYEEETLSTDKLKKLAYRFISSRVIDITQNNYETFINDNPGKPKVLLFTDKKSTPIIYKALSSHFDVSAYSINYIVENSIVRIG